MAPYFKQELLDEVNRRLQTPPEQQSIITTYKAIMSALSAGGVRIRRQVVHVRDRLCHPKNRSGVMLNGFNAHAKAEAVLKIGANRHELHGAVAIEMQPAPADRAAQIEANRSLALASKGLIAEPQGRESFLTLGTGHMASFCRAALAKCHTPFKALQSADGKTISLEVLTRDAEWKQMLEVGWEFEILPWEVEKSWPTLPEFMQRALQAANSVAQDATEWETAIAMAETFEAMESPCWDLAMSAATAGNPACAHYVYANKNIAELYGGWAGAPLTRQQDAFAKTMGENKRLGEEFTTCIADVAFHPFEPRSCPF